MAISLRIYADQLNIVNVRQNIRIAVERSRHSYEKCCGYLCIRLCWTASSCSDDPSRCLPSRKNLTRWSSASVHRFISTMLYFRSAFPLLMGSGIHQEGDCRSRTRSFGSLVGILSKSPKYFEQCFNFLLRRALRPMEVAMNSPCYSRASIRRTSDSC